MHCLVIAATATELKPFLDEYKAGINMPAAMHTDALVTGIGLTAATWSLTRQISINRPDIVIQAGVAGCFDTSIPLGTVMAVKKDTMADQGVIEKGILKSIFDLQLAPPGKAPFSNGWLSNQSTVLKKIKLKKVTGISVNEITTSRQKQRLYREKFNPTLESMEGAALHYVCLQEKIPFVQLRSISNYIGERNKKKWNLKDAVINLNKELIRLLHQL